MEIFQSCIPVVLQGIAGVFIGSPSPGIKGTRGILVSVHERPFNSSIPNKPIWLSGFDSNI